MERETKTLEKLKAKLLQPVAPVATGGANSKLPPLIYRTIEAMNIKHNIPFELALQSVLGVANFAVHTKADVDSGVYGTKPVSLYFIGLAPTAASKSTAYGEIREGIERWQTEQQMQYPYEKEKHELLMSIYKKAKTAASEQAKKQGNLSGIQIPIEPPPAPTFHYLNSKVSTLNGLIDLLYTQPMTGVLTPEGGAFFNSHAFQGKDVEKSAEMVIALTALWDGDRVDRVNGMNKTFLKNRRFCLMLLLQDTMFKKVFSNSSFSDQGFLHRLLVTQCASFKKPKMVTTADVKLVRDQADNTFRAFNDRIYSLLNTPFKVNPLNPFELQPPAIRLDDDADLAIKTYGDTKNDSLDSVNEDWKGFVSRAHEYVLRLSATFALFENKPTIQLVDVEAAIELFEMYIKQREELDFEATPKTDNAKIARKIIDWMARTNCDKTLNDFRRFAPCGYRKLDAEQRKALLNEMLSTGEVEIYKNAKNIDSIRTVLQ